MANVQDPTAWLRHLFNTYDQDRSGELDVGELQQALALGNLHFGVSDVDQMIRAFDTRGRRRLSFPEFQRLHEFLLNIQSSFNYFDADRNRTLQTHEVQQALRHAGFQLDAPVLTAMMSRHDPDNSGTLSLDEYIRMCLFLQSCVRTFTAFDPQRAGYIRLDFNQWVYAASHVA